MKTFRLLILLFFVAISFSGRSQDYYQQGYDLYMAGKTDSAVAVLTRAIENNQQVGMAYVYRGAARIYQDDLKGAMADLDYAMQLDRGNAKAFYYQTRIYYNQKDLEMAYRTICVAIALDPNDAAAYDMRSIIQMYSGFYDKALEDANTAIRLDPNDVAFYSNRAFILYTAGKLEEALVASDEAISRGSGGVTYTNKGLALAGLKRHEEAIACYTKAISDLPAATGIHFMRGMSYSALGEKEKACADFYKSKELGYAVPAEIIINCN